MAAMFSRRFIGILAASTLALSACSSTDSTGDTAADAADGQIVATTQVWADVASLVTGQDVPAIISNTSVDPHDYEPTAADLAQVAKAVLVVANGGAYDARIYGAAEDANVVSALPLTEAHEHEHGEHGHDDHDHEGHDHDHAHEENEHIWYSTAAIAKVGADLAQRTDGNTDALDEKLEQLQAKLDSLKAARVAQTHPIADAIIEESALEDVTPESFRHATLNHSEPSSAALAEFIAALESGEIDILINNPQSPNGVSDKLVEVAKANNVKVVDIYETPPNGENFFDYFAKALDEL
ncbi:zinc ABC transporter substrate-binding protein [Corynebacterium sp. CCUG 61414]|nr:zinc ABC transporter substrate-binding protein [Corynebacterium sp. CCUG 61414]MCQ4612345.1 zinc ABC transporter substrate-binding protein [Corynebacterium sp. CCUG 51687]MCQ4616617.1 zinc ABC transporter substrate-binding protein [Corynebacterium pseudogenitalium]